MRKTSRVLLRVPAPIVASLHEVRSERAQRVLNLSRARADGAGKALSHRSTGRRGSREEVAREHFCPQENQVSRGAQGRPAATAPTQGHRLSASSPCASSPPSNGLASIAIPVGPTAIGSSMPLMSLARPVLPVCCVVGCHRRISAATPVFLGRDGSHCDPPPHKMALSIPQPWVHSARFRLPSTLNSLSAWHSTHWNVSSPSTSYAVAPLEDGIKGVGASNFPICSLPSSRDAL
jgi:hypothetical protein